MGDVNLEIKLSNLDERVIKIEDSGGGSGGDGYITSVSNDFNVINKKLSLSNDVTTKLSKVDTTDNLSVELAKKIDKPASATNGQVLTYNGTSNEWEAQDSKGGSITEPTELEKGIIGGDEWVAQSYTKGATVIYNNKIYYCKADCSASNLPSEPDSNYWEETSISKLKDEVNSSLNWKSLIKNYTPTNHLSGNINVEIPSDAKEVLMVATMNNKIYQCVNSVPISMLSGYFQLSFYGSATDYGNASFNFENKVCKRVLCSYKGTNVTTSECFSLLYR